MTDSNSTDPAEPVEILLAEDEPSDADLCMRALRRKNAANHIVWVKDGAEALDFLFARGAYADRSGADRPRLLLLDIKMPLIDGFEVLRQVRADERLAAMPVVIMTSSSEERDIAEGYRLGVNSYVTKPVELRGLPAGRRRRRHVLAGPQQGPRTSQSSWPGTDGRRSPIARPVAPGPGRGPDQAQPVPDQGCRSGGADMEPGET